MVDWALDCAGFGMVIDKRDGGVVMAGFGGSGVTTALGDSGVGIGTGCCDSGVGATAIAAIWVLRELDLMCARASDSDFSISCGIC